MSAWRRHQFVTSTQTARTRLAPTFVLVKRVLRVTVIPVKVKWSTNHWLNENVSDKCYIFITWNGLLSLQEQWYHLIVLCCCVFNKWTIIGIRTSQNGRTIVKRNKTLILEKNENHNLFPNAILDIDECAAGTHNCSEKAECNNLKGSFNCTCKTGFTADGQNCSGDHWFRSYRRCLFVPCLFP